MKLQSKLKMFHWFEPFFPIWALRRQANITYHLFDVDIADAKKNREKLEEVEYQRYWEVSEYEDRIRAIKSQRLTSQAERLYIYLPDLEWEDGKWGDRYLNKVSLSKLYHAVKEQRDKNREYRLKLAGTLTGIIGALIGLLAVWKK